MRLLGILLLLCVSVGTVSCLSLTDVTSWLGSFFSNPLDKFKTEICSYLAQHPDRAATAIQKINDTLQATNATRQTFVLTINYINSPQNQQALTGGTSTCTTFFNGLYNALVNDLQNKKASSTDAKQQALNTLINWLNSLKSSTNG